ncbi:MAG: 50S ribosomal protein L6 [Pseudomonadales bacterium]|nr:50S ribosomal protein L6 [Pseudomonadales bacterium]
MSRVANSPVKLPSGVEVKIAQNKVSVKGAKGQLELILNDAVSMAEADGQLTFKANSKDKFANAMAGTTRSLLNNMVQGVTEGFEKKLTLLGVGYRASAKGKKLNLQLGFSHPIEYDLPNGIEIQTPSQTEIIVQGIDKQVVGQVAAEIRSFRPPEPYKGKGVRYADERVRRKEAKKK